MGSMAAARNRRLELSRQIARTSPWLSGSAATRSPEVGVCPAAAWKMLLPLTNRTAPGFDSQNNNEGGAVNSVNTSARLVAADQSIHSALPSRNWKKES
jgi:hypothetical protein